MVKLGIIVIIMKRRRRSRKWRFQHITYNEYNMVHNRCPQFEGFWVIVLGPMDCLCFKWWATVQFLLCFLNFFIPCRLRWRIEKESTFKLLDSTSKQRPAYAKFLCCVSWSVHNKSIYLGRLWRSLYSLAVYILAQNCYEPSTKTT